MKRTKQKQKLPPYIFLKHGDWYVKVQHPTPRRDAKGKIIYVTDTRKCVPETSERAAQIVAALKGQVAQMRGPTRKDRGRVPRTIPGLQAGQHRFPDA